MGKLIILRLLLVLAAICSLGAVADARDGHAKLASALFFISVALLIRG